MILWNMWVYGITWYLLIMILYAFETKWEDISWREHKDENIFIRVLEDITENNLLGVFKVSVITLQNNVNLKYRKQFLVQNTGKTFC